MRKGSTLSLYAAAILLIVAGIAMSAIGEVLDGNMPKAPQPGVTSGAAAEQTAKPASIDMGNSLSAISASTVLTEDSRIFWVTGYIRCGHERVREETPDLSFFGKTVAELAAHYPDCKLEIEDGIIRMTRTVDQYCPDHYYIKSDDSGNIYVYRNMEGLDKLTMVMKLNFTIAAVPPDFQPLLQEGMAFGSVEEIEGLIEDADS